MAQRRWATTERSLGGGVSCRSLHGMSSLNFCSLRWNHLKMSHWKTLQSLQIDDNAKINVRIDKHNGDYNEKTWQHWWSSLWLISYISRWRICCDCEINLIEKCIRIEIVNLGIWMPIDLCFPLGRAPEFLPPSRVLSIRWLMDWLMTTREILSCPNSINLITNRCGYYNQTINCSSDQNKTFDRQRGESSSFSSDRYVPIPIYSALY